MYIGCSPPLLSFKRAKMSDDKQDPQQQTSTFSLILLDTRLTAICRPDHQTDFPLRCQQLSVRRSPDRPQRAGRHCQVDFGLAWWSQVQLRILAHVVCPADVFVSLQKRCEPFIIAKFDCNSAPSYFTSGVNTAPRARTPQLVSSIAMTSPLSSLG